MSGRRPPDQEVRDAERGLVEETPLAEDVHQDLPQARGDVIAAVLPARRPKQAYEPEYPVGEDGEGRRSRMGRDLSCGSGLRGAGVVGELSFVGS